MLRLVYTSAIFILAILLQTEALAWGQNGHRVVGQVAQNHIKKKVSRKLYKLLGGESLAEASVWMDDIRSDSTYDHTHDWHWVTIPDSLKYEETDKNPKGDILEAINRISAALKQGGLPLQTEREYIKYLVHLVGDIHQPLHVGSGHDRGGNAHKVEWFRKNSNLHRVWDTEMIESSNLSFSEITGFLSKPSREEISLWQKQSPEEWAMESKALRPQVYNLPEDNQIGYEYMYHNWDTVEHRLLQAGVRLAGLLNEIYG
jgi:hypothetical protein